MTEWVKPPRPRLANTVNGLSLLVRVWALPLALLGWLLGVIVQALVAGFTVAHEIASADWADRLRKGERRLQEPTPDDEDDYDSLWLEADELRVQRDNARRDHIAALQIHAPQPDNPSNAARAESLYPGEGHSLFPDDFDDEDY